MAKKKKKNEVEHVSHEHAEEVLEASHEHVEEHHESETVEASVEEHLQLSDGDENPKKADNKDPKEPYKWWEHLDNVRREL